LSKDFSNKMEAPLTKLIRMKVMFLIFNFHKLNNNNYYTTNLIYIDPSYD